ncbi:receptor protein [Shigella sonnei]|nr:receptor protein [Shigella sonnei]
MGGGKPAARQGDMTRKGLDIVQGSAGVLIGAPTGVACSVCPGGITYANPVNPVNPVLGAKVLKFATAIRNHWHVENKLHWRLDVVMNEDDCKIRRGNAAELFSGIRHITINILTNDKVFKAGLRRKMRKAAMDRNYLASVLAGSGLS